MRRAIDLEDDRLAMSLTDAFPLWLRNRHNLLRFCAKSTYQDRLHNPLRFRDRAPWAALVAQPKLY